MSRDEPAGPGGFLARWSRRKRGEDPPEPAEIPPGPEEKDVATPDEIAALPRFEDWTAETPLGPFLRKGVPALLRREALRRAWQLDPAIRDFVGEARDYSWDWNVPGGVPVSGPLAASSETDAILARMFSTRPSDESAGDRSATEADRPVPHDPATQGSDPADIADQPQNTRLPDHMVASAEPDDGNPDLFNSPTKLAEDPVPHARGNTAAATGSPAEATRPTSAGPRRHGGAIPR